MKVNILTMHRVENYGSFLQSYGLKKLLSEKKAEVSFLDIEQGEQLPDSLLKSTLHEYSNNKKLDKYIFKKFFSKLKEPQLTKMYKEYWEKYLGFDERYQTIPLADNVIIGSDEVFNCLQKSPWGYSNQIFGNIPVSNVATYAASCGFTNYADLSDELRRDIYVGLKKLSAISVRDNNTLEFVKSFGFESEQITQSLDPVLIANFDEELNLPENQISYKKDYLVVYAYKNRIHKKEEIEKIKSLARKYNLKIIALGGYQKWADDFWILNPFQLLNAFKNSKFIITDTFHGSIFSIKYNLKYATILRDSNKNKLIDLFKRLSQEEHLVSDLQDLETIFLNDLDFSKTNSIIDKSQEESDEYLSRFLNREFINE